MSSTTLSRPARAAGGPPAWSRIFSAVTRTPTLPLLDLGALAVAADAAGAGPGFERAKRLIDLTGAAAGLVLLAPVMVLIALAIRLESPGPVIFRQRRLGRGGRPFWFLKFRTMVADAEARLAALEAHNEAPCGVLFKIRRDPRVTRLGLFLRRSSLDELPQLWNVLRGEMSLVGPRPLQLRDSERLAARAPGAFARRLTVPPGLTGAWQVGGRSETDGLGMLALDLGYVENRSLLLDLSIIGRTFGAVIRGRGAY
jgi:lipopolysaccharide/colanic/teichoic acid biosynthesis glycosyltransferase